MTAQAGARLRACVARSGALVRVDTVSEAPTVVDISPPAFARCGFALSPDARTIYFGAERPESDIWIVDKATR